jgi:molybdopterin converting factor small subunit
MRLRVKLFAVARQMVGRDAIELDLGDEATIRDVRKSLAAAAPDLAPLLPRMLFAVGTDYARDETKLSADSDVACIPPVSGG